MWLSIAISASWVNDLDFIFIFITANMLGIRYIHTKNVSSFDPTFYLLEYKYSKN